MSTKAATYEAEVLSRTPLAAHLVRLVLGGPGLAGFTSTAIPDEWVGLVVPGQFQSRYYTVRSWDGDRLTLDVVVHDVGLVTEWAAGDCVGDLVTVTEPKGSFDMPPGAAWLMLVGDLTALPAIARIAAEAAPGTRMRAIIEVHDAQEEQSLATKGDLEVEWVHRSAAFAGSPTLAERAIEAIGPSSADTYIWVACEKADVRAVRKFMKSQQTGWKHKYVAWYWERGVAEPV